jgi:hypothetical protein
MKIFIKIKSIKNLETFRFIKYIYKYKPLLLYILHINKYIMIVINFESLNLFNIYIL